MANININMTCENLKPCLQFFGFEIENTTIVTTETSQYIKGLYLWLMPSFDSNFMLFYEIFLSDF